MEKPGFALLIVLFFLPIALLVSFQTFRQSSFYQNYAIERIAHIQKNELLKTVARYGFLLCKENWNILQTRATKGESQQEIQFEDWATVGSAHYGASITFKIHDTEHIAMNVALCQSDKITRAALFNIIKNGDQFNLNYAK